MGSGEELGAEQPRLHARLLIQPISDLSVVPAIPGTPEAGGRDGEAAQGAVPPVDVGVPEGPHIVPVCFPGVCRLDLIVLWETRKRKQSGGRPRGVAQDGVFSSAPAKALGRVDSDSPCAARASPEAFAAAHGTRAKGSAACPPPRCPRSLTPGPPPRTAPGGRGTPLPPWHGARSGRAQCPHPLQAGHSVHRSGLRMQGEAAEARGTAGSSEANSTGTMSAQQYAHPRAQTAASPSSMSAWANQRCSCGTENPQLLPQ